MSTAEDILKDLDKTENKIKEIEKERIKINHKLQQLKAIADDLRTQYNILKSKEASSVNWAENTYDWYDDIIRILTHNFKLQEFRHQQLAAINAILSRKNVLLVMPTGGGKSLCYQLPALATKGITVVVSPLLSLIDDQIISLRKLGIHALALNSTNSKTPDGKMVYDALNKGIDNTVKIIYITPEYMAKSKKFMSSLQKCYSRGSLDRFAIDEVHCCSQWGHDFRPDFKYLHILKTLFPDIPLIGLTATATDTVIADCQKMLNIEGCVILKASYNRSNLYYEVKEKPTNQKKCVELLSDMILSKYRKQSGIIYTTTINDSVDLAKALKDQGISVACYHANMDANLRHKIHTKWLSNVYQVIVATVAFGMGIDKPDVRFVIHHSLPKSMANFYQESGRAGRDGERSDCILLYNFKDVFRNSSMVCSTQTGSENLYNFVKYCLDAKNCRRSIIATHFDDVWDATDCNKMCDHCLRPGYYQKVDITKYCLVIYKIIEDSNKSDTRLTATKLLDAWYKNGGGDKPSNREIGENIVIFLLINNYLKEDLHFTPYNTISYLSKGFRFKTDSKISMYIKTSTQQSKLDETLDQISFKGKKTNLENLSNESKKIKRKNSGEIDDKNSSSMKKKRIKSEDMKSEFDHCIVIE